MKYLILIFIAAIGCKSSGQKSVSQKKNTDTINTYTPDKIGDIAWEKKYDGYREYDACATLEYFKGKKNHGKAYCVCWNFIREYKDGRKDTTGFSCSGNSFLGDTYDKYEKLSERGKYIVDSLREDGITPYQNNYLSLEPHYMKPGKKIEQLWSIEGKTIMIYEYLFFHTKDGEGCELKREFEVK